MTMNDLERYIEAHIAPEDELLRELDRETHLSVVQPRMLSGHMQGRLLEMLVRMLAPKRILSHISARRSIWLRRSAYST